jgi:flagellar protein FlaG
MSMDIASVQPTLPPNLDPSRQAVIARNASGADPAPARTPPVVTPAELKNVIRDLERVSATFNTRLSFSVNEKLDEVVVKVIDTNTDKVVREIPPEELQRVHERIREVIGLLFDKQA